MSSHLLIVPVTVIFVRFSNSCDLEHRAGLLLSGQAVQYVHYYVCLPSSQLPANDRVDSMSYVGERPSIGGS